MRHHHHLTTTGYRHVGKLVWGSGGKDRWANWYLGHRGPSLAQCERETDVNELLSQGWRIDILWSYLIYPPHLLLSWGSRQPLEARAWVLEAREGIMWGWRRPTRLNLWSVVPLFRAQKYAALSEALLVTVWAPVRNFSDPDPCGLQRHDNTASLLGRKLFSPHCKQTNINRNRFPLISEKSGCNCIVTFNVACSLHVWASGCWITVAMVSSVLIILI